MANNTDFPLSVEVAQHLLLNVLLKCHLYLGHPWMRPKSLAVGESSKDETPPLVRSACRALGGQEGPEAAGLHSQLTPYLWSSCSRLSQSNRSRFKQWKAVISCFVAVANFHGVNVPAMADFKQPA